MIKTITFISILLFSFNGYCGDEIISSFNQQSVPVLNEELRKTAYNIQKESDLRTSSDLTLQEQITALITVPTGAIIVWTTNTAPTDFLLCYGQAVSRTTYADLFSVIGTNFGTGDGSTTFNLPDLRGRFPLGQDDMGGTGADRVTHANADTLSGAEGAETHTLSSSEIPSHNHSVSATFEIGSGNGSSTCTKAPFDSDLVCTPRDVDVSQSSFGGGGAHNNMPPYLTLNYIIRT